MCGFFGASPFFEGGMAMYVGGSILEYSTDGLFSVGECELSSSLSNNFDDTNVRGVSLYTSSHNSFEVHDQFLHSGEDHDDIPLCAGFGRKR